MKRSYVIVAIVLASIYLLPNLLFHMEDYQREKTITHVQKQQLVSMEADSMYLVNQLHFLDYQGMDYVYDEQLQKQRHKELGEEVKKMKEFGLIKEDVYTKFEAIRLEEDYKSYIFHRKYSYEESYTTQGNEMYVGDILMEAKTNKIIKFYLISDESLANDEMIMKKYIQYLGLDIVDDWTYIKNEDKDFQGAYMTSKKAQLKVYTNTDRIVMDKENNYENMYRILFRVETHDSKLQAYVG